LVGGNAGAGDGPELPVIDPSSGEVIIVALAAANGTRLHLEFGGKAPFVVFDDADLEAAIRGAVAATLINTGQDCMAATRAYVHRSIFDDFVAGVADPMRKVRLGAPTDPYTDQGPLVSFKQRDRVAAMVERARKDGAEAVAGGRVPDGALGAGAYYEPTLLIGADQRSEIVQQETFGRVLAALPFDADKEAIDLANDVPFGLAASAWTRDVFRAQLAARRIEAGTVWVNDHIPIISEMSHGGMKASGYGKDMSSYSFDEYTQVKHVMSDITGDSRHRAVALHDLGQRVTGGETMRILHVGASGTVGTAVADALESRGHVVLRAHRGSTTWPVDITDPDSIGDLVDAAGFPRRDRLDRGHNPVRALGGARLGGLDGGAAEQAARTGRARAPGNSRGPTRWLVQRHQRHPGS
jgi:hypothetical protein